MRYICPVCVAILITGAHLVAQESEWQPLMDGKTLAGWHAVGAGAWTVEEGAFVGRANNEALYGLLVSDATYKDFAVRFKFQCPSGDSGFYIRTIIQDPDQAHGLQAQIGPAGSGTGGLYESYGRGWLSKPTEEVERGFLKPAGEWNEMLIVAQGGHIVVHVNGVKSAEFQDETSRREGHLALQLHSGCVMEVRFKDIAIRQDRE
ncbi:MAG: 3-keto-disaccharide hydrolase [Candidatus Zipacnadales bacterium]